jgi:hypothetical protein
VDKGIDPDYAPSLDRHFAVENGILTARCGLEESFFAKLPKGGVSIGTGPLWVTRQDWSTTNSDFELLFDYKWFQEEPMKNYGDFPDLHVGFRLNPQGDGYYLRWGMLGQILVMRAGQYPVAHGVHAGLKGKWARVRLRAAGPILKVKIWSAAKPEPPNWSAEGFDDWKGAQFTAGAVTLGFYGRKLFNTCVYEFRDVQLRTIADEEARAEKFFDPSSGPRDPGRAVCSDTTPIKLPELPADPVREGDLAVTERDANVQALEFGSDGLSFSSTDGKPAFVWVKASRGIRLAMARMKGTPGSRPLFAIRGTDKDGTRQMAYMDPVWHDGIAALLWKDADHTNGAYLFGWRPDTWADFVAEAGHWLKWQIRRPDEQEYAAFTGSIVSMTDCSIGLGVAGTGAVKVRAVFTK